MKLFAILLIFSFLATGCLKQNEQLINTGNRHKQSDANIAKRLDSYRKLAVIALNKRNFPGAYEQLFKAERLDNRDYETKNLLGLTYLYDHNLLLAEQKFKEAVALKKDYSEGYNHLGITYSEQGRYPEAIAAFKNAVKNLLYRTPDLAYVNMGRVYLKMNRTNDAKDAFYHAIGRNKRNCSAYIMLGEIEQKKGNNVDAERIYREPHKYCDEDPVLSLKLGVLLLKQQKNSDATAAFSRCVDAASKQRHPVLKECQEYMRLLNRK